METEDYVDLTLASAKTEEFTHGRGTGIDMDDGDHELRGRFLLKGSRELNCQ